MLLPVLLFTGCDWNISQLGRLLPDMVSFSFGYNTANPAFSESLPFLEQGSVQGTAFMYLNDEETIEAARGDTDWGDAANSGNRVEYSGKDLIFEVRTIPEDAEVTSVEVLSSDKKIIDVVSVSGKHIRMKTKDVGDVELTVTVHGKKKDIRMKYPVRVVDFVGIDFHITPYWLGSIFTRIRMRATSLPYENVSVATEVQDSVTVCGYCEWYDFRNNGSKPIVYRDSVKFPLEERKKLISTNWKTFVRNVTSGVRDIRDRSVKGSKIVIKDGVRDTVDHVYGWIVEQIIVDFNVFAANPYYEYYFNACCDRTTDVLVEDTGAIEDGGSDDYEEYDSSKDGKAFKEEEKKYFVVNFNGFKSDEEKDKATQKLKDELDGMGYSDNLSDDEKKDLLNGSPGV